MEHFGPLSPLHLSAAGLGLWLIAASVVTYALFRSDRRRAILGQVRVPEAPLLWLASFGGWPGALLALRRFRGLRFSASFRGWLRGIIAAELLFLGMATIPQGVMLGAAEQVAALALGNVTAAERRSDAGRVRLDSDKRSPMLSSGPTNVVPLRATP
ncbi:MAG TPA: DUF1294 domain-containing protein [Paracoccaceae bacterium]|nr:DUF1294 domain-containing protein [Paracoccaceae bacterium]HMO71974.1 DUF1294 domain-containing protein [Paracoccaceae bacterium]